MPSVKLKISAVNNKTYPKIILRKFFNMIFVSEDGKKLNIYTATVFGGVKAVGSTETAKGNGMPKENRSENPKEIPIASYDKSNGNMSCTLDFEYEGDIVLRDKVCFEDKTKSLWKQAECMRQVWEDCDEVQTQDEVQKLFQEVYPQVDNQVSFDMSKKGPVYHIYEEDKKSHECIVARGRYEQQESAKYRLLSDPDMEHDGMEFMNWIKAEIPLSESILGKLVKYRIALENAEEYYTPDFTWYFAPPMGYSVEEDSATVEIAQKSMRNLVQSVADDTTVRFEEWEEEEIDDRRKARVYISSYTSEDPCILKRGIKVNAKIDNPRRMGNRQFLLGLLVAFVLSFCSDKTRINDYYGYIQEICQCGEQCLCGQVYNLLGFLFPLLAVATYLSMIFPIKKCVPDKKKKTKWLFRITKAIGIGAAALVLFYVFFAWLVLPDIMGLLIHSCTVNNAIIFALSGVGLVCNAVYILYCMIFRKKKIYDFL